MKTTLQYSDNPGKNRRNFLKNGILMVSGAAGFSLMNSCNNQKKEVMTPSEDLMREHGLLSRIMFIYDNCKNLFVGDVTFDRKLLTNSALIVRTFVEDYHEKLEEDYLFPRFSKARQLDELVQVLYMQHHAGRVLTDQIVQIGNMKTLSKDDTQKLVKLMDEFNRMYRPHKSREDTVLFPSILKVVSESDYHRLGEEFEKKERNILGQDGFETMVEKVANIEKQLGIYELYKYTPVA